jgi:hypothetical protein
LTGSVALDDFHRSASDIDFVAVTRDALSKTDLIALERAHILRLARRLWWSILDGLYVTWRDLTRDLTRDPALADPAPSVHEGQFHRGGAAGDPVTWQILTDHGVVVRGPRQEDLNVWVDRWYLDAWLRQNLETYWQPWQRRSRWLLSRRGVASLTPWVAAWGVLGVRRIHYTRTTGRIISKDRAGQYAQETFAPRWHRIVGECVRIYRSGTGLAGYHDPFTHRRDALDFVAMAIDSARHVGCQGRRDDHS